MSRTPHPIRDHVATVLSRLKTHNPVPEMALTYANPFELLVATVLSAQTTDRTVNRVTPVLFSAYPTPAAMGAADPERLRTILRPTGFFQRKGDHIRRLAQDLEGRFNGTVPDTMEELVTLPGVGRKTASVVLAHAFGTPAIFVDTHVARVSRRLGWTLSSDPVRIEATLAGLIPREDWIVSASRLLLHGRHICLAKAPRCQGCPLFDLCQSRQMESAPSRN